jgi:signal transduction histidine kinase
VPRARRISPSLVVASFWIAPAVLAVVAQIGQRRLWGEPPATLQELLWGGGDWFIYAFLTPPIFAIARRWPIERPRVASRIGLHLAFSLLFCVAWAVGGKLLQLLLGLLVDARALDEGLAPNDWLGWIFVTLPFGAVVYLCMTGVAHAFRYFGEATEREVQLARLSEQLAGARYAALEAQVNPHFLFNTLNTIAVRARDGDNAGTVRMVEQLSDMLRRTLTRHRAAEVPLEEELDLVRQYLAIEQARFSDRLRPEFSVDGALMRAAVPSFSLQHLVENAIRHGIAKRTGAGRLAIAARLDGDMLVLAVTDDGVGVTAAPIPDGHGIAHTRERLRALYGDRASLDVTNHPGGGTIATLTVPYRTIAREEDSRER